MTAEVLTPSPQPELRRDPEEGSRRSRRRSLTSLIRMIPLVPAIFLMLVFLAGPIIWSLWGSLTDASLTGRAATDPQFIGVDNYTRLFADPLFPQSVWLTVVFTLVSAVIAQTVLGLSLALLMNKANKKVGAVVGTIIVAAWILPEIVAAFVAYAFFSQDGTLNQMLSVVGLDGPNWLYSFPMLAVICANIWRGAAFSMMIYQAALNDVPPEITEAAMIDGAGGAKRLIYVTLPMIRQTITTTLMLITLQTLSLFTLIFVMTGGGPSNNSTTLPILAYKEAFRFSDIGYGTAIATVMLAVGAAFSIVYIRALRAPKD
ncbi:amino acid ABC transporter permease [Salinibacterium xinjiangense]|uniref:Carbohydrate ABC transporter membrane protein 1, CUT1 family n=1 Tax=Salinibacterium xinjiangense TaxID=386302 RepID=A0A2C8ZVP2_9MICO|nr:amino acid ABC transporter permease [Salinibacterium xinjiangense]SOE69725.1 carbohydrate ABC transporter membrane protein 1, CUT1 family [Salinibacterium xinjiangense]